VKCQRRGWLLSESWTPGSLPPQVAAHGRYGRRKDTEHRERAPPSAADGEAAFIDGTGALGDVLVAPGDVVHVLTLNP
jgi:hypothetical protein